MKSFNKVFSVGKRIIYLVSLFLSVVEMTKNEGQKVKHQMYIQKRVSVHNLWSMYYANVRFPKAIKRPRGENRGTLLRLILDKFRYTFLGHAKNSKWVWSWNTTIINCRQPCGTARKSRSTTTRHQEDKPSKATSSLFPIKMIAILEWT